MERRAVRLRAIGALAAVIVVLGACGSDGPAANLRPTTTIAGEVAPTPTDAPSPDPEPELPAPELPAPDPPAPDAPEAPAPEAPTPEPPAPPAPEPPAPEPTPDPLLPDDDGDDDGGIGTLMIVLIVGGLLLAAVVIIALIKRSRGSTAEPTTSTPSPQSSLLTTAQWIHDQLTLELMAAPPAAAQQRWTIERSRLDNVAIGALQQAAEGHDPNWQPFAQTVSALAAAIDTNLALRAQVPPNAQLITDSTDVVSRDRATLQQLIVLLRPTIDR
jgi:hypothetical protein